jgi:hypothetical protein
MTRFYSLDICSLCPRRAPSLTRCQVCHLSDGFVQALHVCIHYGHSIQGLCQSRLCSEDYALS